MSPPLLHLHRKVPELVPVIYPRHLLTLIQNNFSNKAFVVGTVFAAVISAVVLA
ncbi:unnamed protein product [Arabidopsis halleri]